MKHLRKFAGAIAIALVLAGCGSDDGAAGSTAAPSATTAGAADSEQASSAAPGEGQAEESKYERIVAVNAETADLALMLVGPENIAAISETAQSPHMGQVPELAEQVNNTLPPGIEPDAEQILSFNPDLVLITPRAHGTMESVRDQLVATGVETHQFTPTDFDSPEGYASAIRELGEILGVPAKAEELASEFEQRIAELDEQKGDKSPSMIALMARGPSIMVYGETNALPGLAMRAGATNAAADLGLTKTSPIDAEQLLKANPDIIFLEDFNGAGMAPFEAMLADPALAEVAAIKNDRIVLIPMTEASTLAGLNMVTGYEKILAEVQK
ncbi:iron complex transport system substrate-binding protein [Trueperella bonasi]|uniref:Iron complex transport system substrate-binding protein n=1 Tax=Trueperella bonasi TaxID=312286 RepID=A0ABT9NF17_9ACTO|nr:ABC transporter substrate-binding protein [Trueperella bonasi]MDP9805991.1 iron complex transport system substrate-binding protein [Trueperella bonasi]